jgi:ABC-type Fe3+-hydroxamate transport system substrate-binding protein
MRIISLVPSITETLFELGLGDQIVAVTRWCTRPAEKVKRKPKVGGTKNPRIESILKWNPDIVILDCDENRKEDGEALQKQGVPTLSFFPKTIKDSIEVIRQLGESFDARLKANALANEIEDRVQKYFPRERFRSLILIWRSPYMTINSDTYVHSASRLFGFDNVFASHPDRYPKLMADEIRNTKPEAVLFPDEPYPFRDKHLQRFKAEFPQLKATQDHRFLLFDGSYIAWHGFGTLRALREFPSQLENIT